MAYKPEYVFTVSDPNRYDDKPVATFHADSVSTDQLPCLLFMDDRGNVDAVHHLQPGHTLTWTNQDGYAPSELGR